jgi:hypothetical protein
MRLLSHLEVHKRASFEAAKDPYQPSFSSLRLPLLDCYLEGKVSASKGLSIMRVTSCGKMPWTSRVGLLSGDPILVVSLSMDKLIINNDGVGVAQFYTLIPSAPCSSC